MYIVIERYYDNGRTWAKVVGLNEYSPEKYPEHPDKYDQYVTECTTLEKAEQLAEDVRNA